MIKHEYKKKNEDGTVKNESRGKKRYDAALIASEKNKMKMLDSKKETDINSRDVVKYATQDELDSVRTGTFSTTKVSLNAGNGKTAELKSVPKSDLEKHIDESERYYIDITNSHQKAKENKSTENKFQKPVPSTMEISAFEPKNIPFPDDETLDTMVFSKKKLAEEKILSNTSTQTVTVSNTDWGLQSWQSDRRRFWYCHRK